MDFGHSHSSTDGQATADAHHRPVCHCLNVTESEIREVIAEHEPQSVRGVSQICGAGAGCMSCHRHIRRMLNERVLYRRSEILADLEPTGHGPSHDHCVAPAVSCGG
jgi:bacterioferritin-associated ferredoxin